MAGNQFDFLFGRATFNPGLGSQYRDRLGRFVAGASPAVAQANVECAYDCMVEIVDSLKDSIQATGRQQRAGEELINALEGEGNREANARGFAVGIPEYLDSTPAKAYWRAIDEGTSALVGRRYFGAFLTPDGLVAPSGDIRSQALTGFIGRSRLGRDDQDSYARAFVIRRPIPRYDYFNKGFKAWRGTNSVIKNYSAAFDSAGLPEVAKAIRRAEIRVR